MAGGPIVRAARRGQKHNMVRAIAYTKLSSQNTTKSTVSLSPYAHPETEYIAPQYLSPYISATYQFAINYTEYNAGYATVPPRSSAGTDTDTAQCDAHSPQAQWLTSAARTPSVGTSAPLSTPASDDRDEGMDTLPRRQRPERNVLRGGPMCVRGRYLNTCAF